MNYELINPLEVKDLDDLLLTNEKYSFFHTSAWARVLYESYGYNPLYFTSINNGKLETLIPLMEVRSLITKNRGVSLPFSDFCEPILDNNTDFDQLFSSIADCGRNRGWEYFEAKGWPESFNKKSSSNYCFEHTLELEKEPENILKKFRNSTKRNIKKALKADIKVTEAHSLDSVVQYYDLHCKTRKEHGLPPQPLTFFKKIFEHIISLNKGMVMLAEYNGETIAGAIYFHFGKKAIYKYGAGRMAFQELRANNLVMWKAIEQYCQHNYSVFSFGKTEPTNIGLLQYKRGWGVSERKIINFRFSIKEKNFIKSKSLVSGKHNKYISKLPICALKLMGTVLYKHFP